MTNAEKQVPATELGQPFLPQQIHWRVGSTTKDKSKGMALAYLDARNVMNRLDEVCSPMGWRDSYEFIGKRIICTIEVYDHALKHWVGKTDGAGESEIEAEKGGISDAFKRAGVKWGIGRYLYDLEAPWVRLDSYKRIERGEQGKLNAIAAAGIATTAQPDPAPEPAKGDDSPAPSKKKAAAKKAPVKKSGDPLSRNAPPPGVRILGAMRGRLGELGLKDDQAGAILNEIILVDLALTKSPEVFIEHMDTILKAIGDWSPSE